jgi:ATP-dependent Lon protease
VRILHASASDDEMQFVAEGIDRVEIVNWLSHKPPYLVEVRYPESHVDASVPETEIKAYAMALISAIKELLPINPLYSEELKQYLNRFNPNDPSPLADCAAAITTATQEQSTTATLLSSNLQSIALANSEQREVASNLAATARELKGLAGQLRAEVGRFRVDR